MARGGALSDIVACALCGVIRYKAALGLQLNPPEQQLVKRWYDHLEGTVAAPLTSMVHVKSQHDMLVKKQSEASMNRVGPVGSGVGDERGVELTAAGHLSGGTPAPTDGSGVALPHQVDDS